MALEGKLIDMPLTDLLYIFQRGSRGGSLILWNATQLGTIWFRHGQPIHALLVSQRDRQILHRGESALMSLTAWPDGQFLYKADTRSDEQPPTISKPTAVLIAESRSRHAGLQPRALPAELTPFAELRLLPDFYDGRAVVELSPEDWTVLTKIRPGATVAAIAGLAACPVERALQIVAHLITLGLVAVVPLADLPPRRLTVAPPPGLRSREVGGAPVSKLTRAIRRRLEQLSSAS